jgi:sugar/nucleoside kinase (ribokinase family)
MSVRNEKDESPEIIIVPNAYTKSAKFTVAAGDTFNAGICLGILAGIEPSAMLVLGNVFTSYFIRTGQRGSKTDIHHFMDHYIEYLLLDQSNII